MERLYCTIEVGGRILPKDTASDAYKYGFLSHDVPEQLQETGFITDMVLESAINGVVYGKDKNGPLTGKERLHRYAVSATWIGMPLWWTAP